MIPIEATRMTMIRKTFRTIFQVDIVTIILVAEQNEDLQLGFPQAMFLSDKVIKFLLQPVTICKESWRYSEIICIFAPRLLILIFVVLLYRTD